MKSFAFGWLFCKSRARGSGHSFGSGRIILPFLQHWVNFLSLGTWNILHRIFRNWHSFSTVVQFDVVFWSNRLPCHSVNSCQSSSISGSQSLFAKSSFFFRFQWNNFPLFISIYARINYSSSSLCSLICFVQSQFSSCLMGFSTLDLRLPDPGQSPTPLIITSLGSNYTLFKVNNTRQIW